MDIVWRYRGPVTPSLKFLRGGPACDRSHPGGGFRTEAKCPSPHVFCLSILGQSLTREEGKSEVIVFLGRNSNRPGILLFISLHYFSVIHHTRCLRSAYPRPPFVSASLPLFKTTIPLRLYVDHSSLSHQTTVNAPDQRDGDSTDQHEGVKALGHTIIALRYEPWRS